MPTFTTVYSRQFRWTNAKITSVVSESAPKDYKEFASSKGVFRGFCASCGSTLTWRRDGSQWIEVALGTIDEKWLLGDRTARVSSQSLTEKGVFEKALAVDDGAMGRDLSTPQGGHMFFRNAIKGATDVVQVGTKYVEVADDGKGRVISV